MIKTLPPYDTATEKTAEIMSRYRPIAPKPDPPSPFPSPDHSHKLRHSTFLRNVWPHLQARPTRTRKRPRGTTAISHHALKRPRPPPPHNLSLITNLSIGAGRGFEDAPGNPGLVTLPLLPCAPHSSVSDQTGGSEFNFVKGFEEEKGVESVSEIPEERDLLRQLQGPVPVPVPVVATCNVITPHPVRPVGSSIRVGCINESQNSSQSQAPKKPDEVEKEVESEILPAVISDSNNKVRMANSAYKEMVGQPECPWLDSMVAGDDERRRARRIGGEVMLHLSDAAAVTHSANGFSCWVRIEWGSTDGKKNSITAFCDVIKLACVSRDYLFTWRFHTQTQTRDNDPSQPICINV